MESVNPLHGPTGPALERWFRVAGWPARQPSRSDDSACSATRPKRSDSRPSGRKRPIFRLLVRRKNPVITAQRCVSVVVTVGRKRRCDDFPYERPEMFRTRVQQLTRLDQPADTFIEPTKRRLARTGHPSRRRDSSESTSGGQNGRSSGEDRPQATRVAHADGDFGGRDPGRARQTAAPPGECWRRGRPAVRGMSARTRQASTEQPPTATHSVGGCLRAARERSARRRASRASDPPGGRRPITPRRAGRRRRGPGGLPHRGRDASVARGPCPSPVRRA